MAKYDTQFMETEAILAAQQEDWVEVDRILSRMTDRELDELSHASIMLARRIAEWTKAGGVQL